MYTLLAILHVWGASPTSYSAFAIELTPGLTQAECVALNDQSHREGRNMVCDEDAKIAAFVNDHGCQVNMRDWPRTRPDGVVELLCVR